MEDRIKPIRKCRWCDDSVGKVNGEFIHTNVRYVCRGNKGTVAE